jgi:hexulose-6-phosphate isomerase
MYAAVNAWSFPQARSVDEQMQAAATAGFAGLELVVGPEDLLRPETPPAEFTPLARRAAELNLQLTSLATALFWHCNYASPDKDQRLRAYDLTRRMLAQAAAAQAGAILVIPAVVGTSTSTGPLVPYADALYRTLEALAELRHDAEQYAVTLAIENVWNRFLLSPIEVADLLDQVNSPYVGFYLDTGNVLAYGYPEDWVATLGGRVARVHAKDYDLGRPGPAGFCPLGAGSVNWPAVIHALRACGYDGPLTYEGTDDPMEACRRLKAFLAAPPTTPTQEQA